jgi:asparagine synthetase B (glutamine-hydrolysing)
MSDFLLDCRPHARRDLAQAADFLAFADDTQAVVIDRPGFGLVITQTGDASLWAPHCASDGSFVAIAGRVAFDDDQWEAARRIPGCGGLAAKVIFDRVQSRGTKGLEQVNGNCAVITYDAPTERVHLVTDVCGMLPVFHVETAQGRLYGSHPDVVAEAADETHRLDETSMAEFILSGTVTPPYSYYSRVRAADSGTIFTIDVHADRAASLSARRYFSFEYRADPDVREEELGEELSATLRRAVRRRTLPRLGRSAIALSGGLDSRAILASAVDATEALAFTCFDQPNRELRCAESIAQSLSAPFLPLQRDPEYYANNAERGVRISGGMGSLANNHFLGAIPSLKREGANNLLTGCYCDYLFKGLPLNRRVHWLTGREQIASFRHEFYFYHFAASSQLAARAQERWESRVAKTWQAQASPEALFHVEASRTFPLFYEGDNQQRVVPQRVTGWCPPFVDRELMELYCRMPSAWKLNRSIFRKVVSTLPPPVRAIPDANTGAAADASLLVQSLRRNQVRVERLVQRLRGSALSEESWLNWPSYVVRSPVLDDLWRSRRNPAAIDLFNRVLGPGRVDEAGEVLKREEPFLFVSLLSLKLWLDAR